MSEALAKLIEFLTAWWHAIRFWDVLESQDLGFVRRLGVYHRDLAPGINWRFPLFERAEIVDARLGAHLLPAQTIRTSDGILLTVRLKCSYQVVDAQTYFLSVYDALDNIRDIASGELCTAIMANTAQAAYDGQVLLKVRRVLKRSGREWGLRITKIQFAECAPMPAMRLMGVASV